MRTIIASRVDAVLDKRSGSIAKALLVGDQSSITKNIRQNMSQAGLAHVLAISGLHLSLVAGGVFVAFRFFISLSYSFAQRLAVKKIAAISGIITALFYLSISGASVSAIRATVMLILIFGAVLAGRRALTMRNVAFAALFVIITDPSSIFRPSFQLSFAAVVALVGIYEIVQHKNEKQSNFIFKFFRFFGGLASTSLIAGIATALFAAYHFQQTAPLGVLGNLVALPIVAFIVLPAGFIAVLLMPLGYEAVFLRIMGFAIEKIIDIAFVVSSWSAGINYSPLLLPISLAIGLFAFAWLAFFTTKFRLIGIALALPLIAIFAIDKPPDILIADGTKAIAVRGQIVASSEGNSDKTGLALISGRAGSFATNAWQETYQEKIGKKLNGLECDKQGCFYKSTDGYSVSLVKSKQAFYEDCYIADIIITHLYAPKFCRDLSMVVDMSDLRKNGMHWLRWDNKNQTFIVRTAITDKNRPWRP
jgi:competence protein ComEC